MITNTNMVCERMLVTTGRVISCTCNKVNMRLYYKVANFEQQKETWNHSLRYHTAHKIGTLKKDKQGKKQYISSNLQSIGFQILI